MGMLRADYLVVGGGIAGLGAALALARRGARGVVLVEREPLGTPDPDAREARWVHPLAASPCAAQLREEGCRRLAEAGLLAFREGFLLAEAPGGLAAWTGAPLGGGETDAAASRLAGLRVAEHLPVPDGGILCRDALRQHLHLEAQALGVHVRIPSRLRAIEVRADGLLLGTEQGWILADTLVLAAGAASGDLGRQAGGLDLAFQALIRPWIRLATDPSRLPGPLTWVDRPLDLQPAGTAALRVGTGESPTVGETSGRAQEADSAQLEALFALLHDLAPDLAEAPVVGTGSDVETGGPDGLPVLGRDPLQPRLVWVAGLGGHGAAAALAAGEWAAAIALGEGPSSPRLDPARFLRAEHDPASAG